MVKCSETKDDSMNWTIALVDFLSLSVSSPRSSRRRLKLHVRTKSGKPRCSLIAFVFIGWCPLDRYSIFSELFSEDDRGWTTVLTKLEAKKRNAHVFKSLLCGFNILQYFLCNIDCSVRLLFSLFPPFSFNVHKWFSAFVFIHFMVFFLQVLSVLLHRPYDHSCSMSIPVHFIDGTTQVSQTLGDLVCYY